MSEHVLGKKKNYSYDAYHVNRGLSDSCDALVFITDVTTVEGKNIANQILNGLNTDIWFVQENY